MRSAELVYVVVPDATLQRVGAEDIVAERVASLLLRAADVTERARADSHYSAALKKQSLLSQKAQVLQILAGITKLAFTS